MIVDKLLLFCLGLFLLLYGIFNVTNVNVVWGQPLMGFAALVAGAVCIVRALK